jgi:hypothetical protein
VDKPSPGTSGELTDPDGRHWTVHRARLDPRIVRRMLKRADTPVLLGGAAGAHLRWITPHERPEIVERIRRCYARPGTGQRACDIEYMGYEFSKPDGTRLLYIEEWC